MRGHSEPGCKSVTGTNAALQREMSPFMEACNMHAGAYYGICPFYVWFCSDMCCAVLHGHTDIANYIFTYIYVFILIY